MNLNDLHYLLLLGFNYSNKAIVSQTSRQGLMPGQPKILEFLLEHEGCTQKEIGEACVLDKSTVTSLLSRMLLLGQVEKIPEKEDRRISRIFLTDQGRSQARQVADICSSVDASAWIHVSPEDREHFIQTFQKVLSNLKEVSVRNEK